MAGTCATANAWAGGRAANAHRHDSARRGLCWCFGQQSGRPALLLLLSLSLLVLAGLVNLMACHRSAVHR